MDLTLAPATWQRRRVPETHRVLAHCSVKLSVVVIKAALAGVLLRCNGARHYAVPPVGRVASRQVTAARVARGAIRPGSFSYTAIPIRSNRKSDCSGGVGKD
jgi:hypothetical protein